MRASRSIAAARGSRAQLAHEAPDGEAELERTARAVALPERHLAGLARRRRHEHAVVRDLLDAPARCAEEEGLADARLEHHFFVELADSCRAGRGAGEEHAVEPAVGDGPGVGDRHALGTLARGERAADAIPRQARPQLRELVGRVAARQHVEDAVEARRPSARTALRARTRANRSSTLQGSIGDHRHDLLREHVERVARESAWPRPAPSCIARVTAAHATQVAAVLREDDAVADGADLVAGAADPLQPARDRGRRFDLDDEIDRAHVDPSSSDEVATSARS